MSEFERNFLEAHEDQIIDLLRNIAGLSDSAFSSPTTVYDAVIEWRTEAREMLEKLA